MRSKKRCRKNLHKPAQPWTSGHTRFINAGGHSASRNDLTQKIHLDKKLRLWIKREHHLLSQSTPNIICSVNIVCSVLLLFVCLFHWTALKYVNSVAPSHENVTFKLLSLLLYIFEHGFMVWDGQRDIWGHREHQNFPA